MHDIIIIIIVYKTPPACSQMETADVNVHRLIANGVISSGMSQVRMCFTTAI